MNLLNPENGLGPEIRSHYDASNAETLDEDVIFIADDYKPVFDGDVFQGPAIENPNISEFQSVYGLISERISCGSKTFDKHDIETVVTPKSWVIDNVISEFMMLLNEGNLFVVDSVVVEVFRWAI